jgi:dephospho-CoA kinase
MAIIVAITGGVSSGKSTVTALFSALGVPVIESDHLARQLVAIGKPAFTAIVNHFGPRVLLTNGQLDRAYLRHLMVNHPDAKAWLEALLHPLIYQESWQHLKTVKGPYALWVVPLLVEKGWQAGTERTAVVDLSIEQQLDRLIQRDQISQQQAQALLALQCDRHRRLAAADDVIDNSGPRTRLPPQVLDLHQHYLQLAATHVSKVKNQGICSP